MITPTVGIVVLKEDKVLLVRHEKAASHVEGVYGLPGGRTEENETPVQTAKRELEEETGLVGEEFIKLSFETPSVAIKRSDGTTKYFSWKVFFCNRFSGELRPTDETTPEWVDVKALDSIPNLLPNTKTVTEEAQTLL